MVDRRGATTSAAALAPATVLAVDPWGWYPFGPLRWLVVSVLVLVAGAATVGRRPLPAAARGPVLAGAVLAAAMAVTAVAGRDPLYAWTGTPERHAGVALWVLVLVALATGAGLDPARALVVVGRGLVVAGLGVGLVGWAEALGWEPDELDAGARLTGTLGSSAFLGAACALLLPAVVGTALDRCQPRPWRIAAGVAGAALVVPLVGSGARSAWLGLAVAAVAVVVARRAELVAAVRAHRRPATAAGLGLAVAAAVVLVLTPAGARLAALGDADAPGGRGRVDEWRVATRVLADHPVLGVGPEGYRIAVGAAVDERYERAHGRDPQPDRAHSAPLDVALAGGLPALVAWGAWVALVVAACARALRRGPPAAVGLAAALVAHLAGQLVLFPLAELEPLAWLLAGVLLAATPRTGDRIRREAAGSDHRFGVVRVGLALLAVAALGAGVLDVAADHRAAVAARALAAEDGPGAAEAAGDAVALRPDVVRLRLLAARAEVAAGHGLVAALDQVDAALRTSPGDPVARRERVRLLVARAAATQVPAHAATARAAADEALADDPVRAELWLLAGEAARLDGDPGAAEAAWERAERLAPRSPAAPVDLALLHLAEGRPGEARAALDRARAIAPDDPRVVAAARLVGR